MGGKNIVIDGNALRTLVKRDPRLQEEIAGQAGITAPRLSRLLRNGTHACRQKTAENLAAALGVELASLLPYQRVESMPSLSSQEQALLNAYRKLDEVERARVLVEISERVENEITASQHS